jgi:hypothetical protein
VLFRSGSASSQEAAAGAAADAGAVEALVQLGRMPGAAGMAVLRVLLGLVKAAEPSLRLPEAVVAARGVEAALAQLRGPVAEQEHEAAANAALRLLFHLLMCKGPSAEGCRQRALAAGGMTLVVQHLACRMAAEGSAWHVATVRLISKLLASGGGDSGATSISPCSFSSAVEAVEAGAVQVLLGSLAFSSGQPGDPDDEEVQSRAAEALAVLAAVLCLGSPADGSRQLPEPMRGALRPAVAALAGLLRSMQLPAVAGAVLRALGNVALADKALAAEAAAAGAGLLAMHWRRRPGAPAQVVQTACRLLHNLVVQGDNALSAGVNVNTVMVQRAAGAGQDSGDGGQAACFAARGAASTAEGKALKMCSACRGVSYCSGACQKRHWGEHKGGVQACGVIAGLRGV